MSKGAGISFPVSDTYLVLIAFGQQDSYPQDAGNTLSHESRLDKIVALLHQHFGRCLWRSNQDSLRIQNEPVVDQAIIGHLVHPPRRSLSRGFIEYLSGMATVPCSALLHSDMKVTFGEALLLPLESAGGVMGLERTGI